MRKQYTVTTKDGSVYKGQIIALTGREYTELKGTEGPDNVFQVIDEIDRFLKTFAYTEIASVIDAEGLDITKDWIK